LGDTVRSHVPGKTGNETQRTIHGCPPTSDAGPGTEVDFLFQQPLYEKLLGTRPEAYNGGDAVRCALALDHDGVWLPFGGFTGLQPQYLAENIYQDEWGTTFQKDDASWPIDAPVDYPIIHSTMESPWRIFWRCFAWDIATAVPFTGNETKGQQ
jgi:hypothetical protein